MPDGVNCSGWGVEAVVTNLLLARIAVSVLFLGVAVPVAAGAMMGRTL
jgi:hypothetical protein